MGTVHDFRSYETAARRHRHKPNVYRALVNRMVHAEERGEPATDALGEAFDNERRERNKPNPEPAA